MEKKLRSDIVLDIFLADFTPKLTLFNATKITFVIFISAFFFSSDFNISFTVYLPLQHIKNSGSLSNIRGIFIPMFIMIILALSGTQPIIGS